MQVGFTRLVVAVVCGVLIPACSSDKNNSPSGNNLTVPAAPVGLHAIPGDATVILMWESVPGAVGYNVKRSTRSGGPYELAAVLFTDTTFVDSPLKNGVAYFFVVSAVNNVGEGPDSLEVSATPMATKHEFDVGPKGGDRERDGEDGDSKPKKRHPHRHEK